jgi:hypothetical protein
VLSITFGAIMAVSITFGAIMADKDPMIARVDLEHNGGKRHADSGLGAPGAHKVETGVGAVAGAVLGGAAAGTAVGGAVGTVIGAIAGAVAGGVAGKAIGEQVNPTEEDAYWRENYSSRPYVAKDATFDDYGPAYRYGVDTAGQYPGRSFDEAEPDLRGGWEKAREPSRLSWDHARHATRDSWQRLHNRIKPEESGGVE